MNYQFNRSSVVNSFIGSGNVAGYINTGVNRGIVIIDGQRITASHGTSSVTAKSIKVIAVDEQGKELDSFCLPTGTDINIDVHVEAGTEVKRIETVSGTLSLHGPATIERVESTNGPVTVEGATKVGSIHTTNGNVEVKAQTVGDIRTVNGSIKRRVKR
jgi:DUF4097 and DUF4098 domain-containing protein YvlB